MCEKPISTISESLLVLRITTWNVNSVRLRLPLLVAYIQQSQPDVICLQETKVVDQAFPQEFFWQYGYHHQLVSGMKSYNGMAVLSKIPFHPYLKRSWCDLEDCRHISVRLENNRIIHNFYVPAGGDIPDSAVNKKFAHKLQFVQEMAAFLKTTHLPSDPVIILGDFNIAPLPQDVWSHQQLLGVVSHTPIETNHLEKVRDSLAWVDAVRQFFPADQKLYSWWSYRAADWQKSNRGRRLDHIWVTPSLKTYLHHAEIITHARGWPTPSDHVPVHIDLGN